MDKDSHNLFEKYFALQETSKRGMAAIKRKKAKKRKAIDKNRKNNQGTSYGSDDIPNVPQDPSVNVSYAGPETEDPLYRAKSVGRGTGENPELKKLTNTRALASRRQGQQEVVKSDKSQPAPQPAPKPAPQPAPQPAPKPVPQPAPQKLQLQPKSNTSTKRQFTSIPKSEPKPVQGTSYSSEDIPKVPNVNILDTDKKPKPEPEKDTLSTFKDYIQKGVKKAKPFGKALKLGAQAIDPFSKRGLLGKAATLAKDAENWARTGSPDPYDYAERIFRHRG